METVNEMIQKSEDVRELKRALSIKMLEEGVEPKKIAEILQVSEQYVSKWKGNYAKEGVSELRLKHKGSQGYMSQEERAETIEWVKDQDQVSVEGVRDYIEEQYGVLYRSKQSYYELLHASGMSYHRTEPANPKRDEEQILSKREELKKKWRNT